MEMHVYNHDVERDHDARSGMAELRIILLFIFYTDMPVGPPVPLLLYTKETVPYRPDKNLCLPL
jgi:hypothetical protein